MLFLFSKILWVAYHPQLLAGGTQTCEITPCSKEKLESDTIADMCDKLACLVITKPVSTMLILTGFADVANAAQNIESTATAMRRHWMNLEELNCTCFDLESLECLSDDSFELDEPPLPSVAEVQLLNQALVIIKELHDIGAHLNDDRLMNGAVELCSHVASHPVNSSSV